MPNYRRERQEGATYFFTLVTYQRRRWLCNKQARSALRHAISVVRAKRPFSIDAMVLLPDHLHCLWTLPPGDADFAERWRLIKLMVSKRLPKLETAKSSTSRTKRKERALWQRRYWEHCIRDDNDYARHCDYIHYNPVKHGFCRAPAQWPYSSFRRFVAGGIYPPDWGAGEAPAILDAVGKE